MSCQFCDIGKKFAKTGQPDCKLEDVLTNLPQLKAAGIKFIDFTGGEPLLHQFVPDMLHAAKKLNLRTSITTNCLLYPERAMELKGLIDLLHFSLDSLNEAENDTIRGKGAFSAATESLYLAKQLGERPDLLFTATPDNYKAIVELAQFAQEQKTMLLVNPIFKYTWQKKIDAQILDYLEQFQKLPYMYQNRALHQLIRNGGNNQQKPRCRAVSSTIVVSPANEVLFPCFHFQQLALPLKNNWQQIRKSPLVKLYKKRQGTFSFCANCTINCYFDPSFFYKLDRYFWLSLLSKLKYGYDKYLRSKKLIQ